MLLSFVLSLVGELGFSPLRWLFVVLLFPSKVLLVLVAIVVIVANSWSFFEL